MNTSSEKKIMDLENRFVAARGGERGSGRDRELGVIGYNLEWIYKEILLNSIQNHILILILQQNKGGGKKMYTCKRNLVPMLYSGKKIK